MSLIKLKNVFRYYPLGDAQIAALNNINLVMDPGAFVAIWGPSGSGKSTLCNLIGLIDSPTSGSISIGGQDLDSLSDDERSSFRNKTIGFIFQRFNLMQVLTALENVMLPLTIRGERESAARAKALTILHDMGLDSFAGQRPDKLSGGQQQRVAIARALVTNPLLVIADEPTANLDSENALKIVDAMRDLNKTRGTTFIFSTHDQRLLGQVRRRIKLHDGSIAEDTTLD